MMTMILFGLLYHVVYLLSKIKRTYVLSVTVTKHKVKTDAFLMKLGTLHPGDLKNIEDLYGFNK